MQDELARVSPQFWNRGLDRSERDAVQHPESCALHATNSVFHATNLSSTIINKHPWSISGIFKQAGWFPTDYARLAAPILPSLEFFELSNPGP